MKVWEFRNGALNDFAMLVHANESERIAEIFDVNGNPFDWRVRPHATVFVEPRRKRAKPRADISALSPGALVLNAKAKAAIGEFLSKFGQLLELEVDGHLEWFYNVTHVIDCIDLQSSTLRASGTIAKEQFFANSVPFDPVIFKDPRTARTRIYVNQAAKELLEEQMTSAGISGAEFAEPGPPPPRPRPTG
ncbi:hypothetical protein [Rhodanobacter ginsengiterrae]|uniref:hypothetical protein n=1 Tax=Rhodanobacter ginsengiterrae TaxID=2008451 RepID=UPI003CF90E77